MPFFWGIFTFLLPVIGEREQFSYSRHFIRTDIGILSIRTAVINGIIIRNIAYPPYFNLRINNGNYLI